VNVLTAVPPSVQFAVLFVIGLLLGSLINAGIYALAWFSRPISPWQRPHPDAPSRQWTDRLPVFGWLGLQRESPLHGRGFWIRPLLLEVACGLGLPALYYWDVFARGLAPPLAIPGFVNASAVMLTQVFVSHAIVICLMLVATFIDFDEKTIPDAITIPGTLAGLILAVVWPNSHLPVARTINASIGVKGYAPLLVTSSDEWPAWLDSH
jgi:leader peptidase (prepilin peptidase) / N-methyltransferase